MQFQFSCVRHAHLLFFLQKKVLSPPLQPLIASKRLFGILRDIKARRVWTGKIKHLINITSLTFKLPSNMSLTFKSISGGVAGGCPEVMCKGYTILSLDRWHCFMIVVVALSEAARPCRLQELAAAMTVEMRLLEFHNVHCRLHPLNRLNSSLKLMQPWRSSLTGAWPRNSGHWARGILAFKNKMATSWTAIRQSFFPHSLFARPQTFALHRKKQRERLNAGQRQVLKKILKLKIDSFLKLPVTNQGTSFSLKRLTTVLENVEIRSLPYPAP